MKHYKITFGVGGYAVIILAFLISMTASAFAEQASPPPDDSLQQHVLFKHHLHHYLLQLGLDPALFAPPSGEPMAHHPVEPQSFFLPDYEGGFGHLIDPPNREPSRHGHHGHGLNPPQHVPAPGAFGILGAAFFVQRRRRRG